MATILLIHGIPGSSRTWDRVAATLDDDHEVLHPDLLGFGGSNGGATAEDLLAPNQARILREQLDRRGVGRMVLVGHDFGGPVAAHLITAEPDRFAALALFSTNAFPDTPIPFPLSMLKVPVLGDAAERLLFSRPSLAMMVRQGMGKPRPEFSMDHYLGDTSQTAAIRSIFASSLRRIRELYEPVEAALASVDVPVTVGWGDRDPFFDLSVGERTAALIPGASFHVYRGAGHFLPEERPERVAADIRDLVEKVA